MKSTLPPPLILAVDDDLVMLTLISEGLEQAGFTVATATNGRDALAAFERVRPALVLTDVKMPLVDGFELCARLRTQVDGRHLPIVFITGLDDVASIQRAYEVGATDFITKPIDWLILSQRVQYILRASQAFQELRESEERFRTLVQAAGSLILVMDREGRLLEFNRAAERFVHCRQGEPLAAALVERLPGGDWEAVDQGSGESTLVALDGKEYTLLWNLSGFTDGEGRAAGWVIVGQDITARRQAEEGMRKLSYAVEQNPISILITDTHGVIEYANPKFSEVSGYSLDEIRGKTPYFLQTNTLSAEEYQRLQQAIADGGVWQGELCNRRKDGEFFWEAAHVSAIRDQAGAITHFLWLREDITARKQAEERIRFLAYYDNLTQLPNRVMLHERLREAIETARLHSRLLAVMFLDLDQFKRINDSMGHAVGDVVLQEVAHRLQECLRQDDYVWRARLETPLPQDLLARLGGDEFVLVLTEVNQVEDVTRIARRILSVIAKPMRIGGSEIFSGCSIGIALYPQDGADMEMLLKNADTALYHAKDTGRNNFQLFSDWMNVAAVQRLTLENHLRKALDKGELSLHYQPQVVIETGRITGVEALLRWDSPELGQVSPSDFIPIAEETGLIIPIGEWVLRTACSQARSWQREGLPALRMAVNLSPRQFLDPLLPQRVAEILSETGLSPELLEFEVTESLLMQGEVFDLLVALKGLGIQLSIDDFGTGYSNLTYLHRFPIDRLKIDRTFVHDINHQTDHETLVAAVIAMARSLRLGVIAEGVETDTQLEILQELECDEMQGYYFSRPYPPDQILAMLRDSLECDAETKRDPSCALVLLDDDPQTRALLRRLAMHVRERLLIAHSAEEALMLIHNHPAAVLFWNPAHGQVEAAEFPRRLRKASAAAICIALVETNEAAAFWNESPGSLAGCRALVKPLSQSAVWAVIREARGEV